MKRSVIAIGLDAADPVLLEKWMSQGHLKNINQLRQQGTYGRLFNTVNYCGTPQETSGTERTWVTFLTGCKPNKTGYWGSIKFDSETYKIAHGDLEGSYESEDYPPFYAVGDDYRVAVMDIPCTALSDRVNGVQILGWGGHFPHTLSHSQPANVLPDIVAKYGKNPVLHKDYGYWWDRSYFERIRRDLKTSVSTRTAICRELLQQEDWDLFFTVFGETHSASHDFWHLSQSDHPLHPHLSQNVEGDTMLEAFEDVDRAIGEILAEAPEDAHILLFSLHGMGNNGNDMFSMTFLPEMLYRYNFPGKVAIAPSEVGSPLPPLITKTRRNTWAGEVWQRKFDDNPVRRLLRPWLPGRFLKTGNKLDLASPYELTEQSAPLNWMPAMWFTPLWLHMKAFALPAFADGGIRINVKGREQHGIVDPSEYEAVCDELTQLVYGLTDARTGEPIVKNVVRTRQSASENDSSLPDADLVVIWRDEPTEVVDSPTLGRVGPIPYYRTGGHRPNGFLMAKGPGITAGSSLPTSQAVDLGPTILSLLGAPIPEHFDGKPLLNTAPSDLAVTV
ncbi:MAG: alkaline phosphatase family protein [Phormidesmis sp. CAN_BIN44]|nr:alkaline phosphatase family protein [Phormidesmis sp. CAN_BIN44]